MLSLRELIYGRTQPIPWPQLPDVPKHEKTRAINPHAMAEIEATGRVPVNPFVVASPPNDMAMDSSGSGIYDWIGESAVSEGIGFLGFPYLAELSQRPEYRRAFEIMASASTRKWIKLSGDAEKVKALEKAMKKFKLESAFRRVSELDGCFGRGHIYLDFGQDISARNLDKPLMIDPRTIKKGSLKAITIVEPIWVYPMVYETTNPLSPVFYKPQVWSVNGNMVHTTRLLTFVGNPLPDILKPAYAFCGLSMTQMMKPYVDNWLRTRQSVSDKLHSFSITVLKTDMATFLGGGAIAGLMARIKSFVSLRDNNGVMVIDKTEEEIQDVSTPLSGLAELQAQAQEQMASIARIPLIEYLGITPTGLNASSDGELRVFYANVKAYQERLFYDPLETVLNVLMLNEWGEIDEDITFEFSDLYQLDDEAKARVRKSDAEADQIYYNIAAVSNEEIRERIEGDPESQWFGVDLSAPPPSPPEINTMQPDDSAHDAAFNESDHPRAENGQFGSKGGAQEVKPKFYSKLKDMVDSSSRGEGPKSFAKRLRNEGFDIPSSSDPDFLTLVNDLFQKKKENEESIRQKYLESPEYIERVNEREQKQQKALDPFIKSPSWNDINKSDQDNIKLFAQSSPHLAELEMNRSITKAIAAKGSKHGFTERHTSKSKDGKVSSRYMTYPGGGEVRVSDHYLPSTPQRESSYAMGGGGKWIAELVIQPSVWDSSIDDILDVVKKMSLSQYEYDAPWE